MIRLQGEYECKVDAKGRFRIPSQLVRQLGEANVHSLHVNRGIEKCLTLYPNNVWLKVTEQVNKLNLYNSQNRKFARYFYRGATELSMDKTDRLLLPKALAEYAEVESDIVLFAFHNRIEVWSKSNYEMMLEEQDDDEFAKLADDVMGMAFSDKTN